MRNVAEIIAEIDEHSKAVDRLTTEMLISAGWEPAQRDEWGRIRCCWQKTVLGTKVLMPKSQAVYLVAKEGGVWSDA